MNKKSIYCLFIFSMLLLIILGCSAKEEKKITASDIQAKLQQMQTKLQEWVQAGNDPVKVQPLMEKLDQHIKNQEFEKADSVIDEILALIESKTITTPEQPTTKSKVFIAPAWGFHQNSQQGDQWMLDAAKLLKQNSLNLIHFSAPWNQFESTKGKLDLKDTFKPLTLVAPENSEIEGVVFVIAMINSNIRAMPADIATKPFDDPEVLSRFDAVIDEIAKQPYSNRITHILLGNEVDGYLSQHQDELKAFSTFYQRGLKRIHEKMPNAKVGTVITAGGVKSFPHIFEELTQYSDFIDYTYYPVESLTRGNIAIGWQMMPVSEVKADLEFLAENAGTKPFAFTEIGYASSKENAASEEQQAEFVREMFRVLDSYQKKGKITFLLYATMYDYQTGVCRPYGEQQGVPDIEQLCSFMESLGLRSFKTGEPRKAWDVFVEGAKKWVEQTASN